MYLRRFVLRGPRYILAPMRIREAMKESRSVRIYAVRLILIPAVLFLIALPAFGATGVTDKSSASPDLAAGKKVYEKVCSGCHDKGVSGAPKIGDKKAWAYRIAKGMDLLVRHAIDGFMCNRGVAPPRGGDPSLSDAEVAAATAYMVEKSR
jgi:cytochrome c5